MVHGVLISMLCDISKEFLNYVHKNIVPYSFDPGILWNLFYVIFGTILDSYAMQYVRSCISTELSAHILRQLCHMQCVRIYLKLVRLLNALVSYAFYLMDGVICTEG